MIVYIYIPLKVKYDFYSWTKETTIKPNVKLQFILFTCAVAVSITWKYTSIWKRVPSGKTTAWTKERISTKFELLYCSVCLFLMACQLSASCTRNSKLIDYKFRFLHRRLATNSFLQKIGIKGNGSWVSFEARFWSSCLFNACNSS